MALTKIAHSMVTGLQISVVDYGADPTGVADSTAALQAARDAIAAQTNPAELVFPEGIYSYSVSPNWAISHAKITAQGTVRLRYTGTGNAVIIDAGPLAADFCWDVQMGRFIVEAPNTANHGVYVRGVHHSWLSFNVKGAGTAKAGIAVSFAVCTVFERPTVSNNETWYSSVAPAYGIYLTQRNAGETVSYCTFNSPVIEGCSSHGIWLSGTLGNTFLSGTSEGNNGWGVYADAASNNDKFWGTDFEVNTLGDVCMLGTAVTLHDCETTNYVYLNGSYDKVVGGLHNIIEIGTSGAGCSIENATYFRYLGPPQPSPIFTTNASSTSGTNILYFASTKAITAGMRVTGTSIPADTFVLAAAGVSGVTTASVKLSKNITGTISSGASITFAQGTTPWVQGSFTDNGTYTHLGNVRDYNSTYNYLTARKNTIIPGAIPSLGNYRFTQTVTGAKFGDAVVVSMSASMADFIVTGCVSAADTVTVTMLNISGNSITPGTISYANIIVTRAAIL